jgi:hypothetical protein
MKEAPAQGEGQGGIGHLPASCRAEKRGLRVDSSRLGLPGPLR